MKSVGFYDSSGLAVGRGQEKWGIESASQSPRAEHEVDEREC